MKIHNDSTIYTLQFTWKLIQYHDYTSENIYKIIYANERTLSFHDTHVYQMFYNQQFYCRCNTVACCIIFAYFTNGYYIPKMYGYILFLLTCLCRENIKYHYTVIGYQGNVNN